MSSKARELVSEEQMLHIRALVTAMPKAYMEHRKDHAYFKQKLSAVTEQGKQSLGKDFTTPAEARVSHFPSVLRALFPRCQIGVEFHASLQP